MKSILGLLRKNMSSALTAAFGANGTGVDPLVKRAGDPKFGDYQSNVAMGLAKKLGQKPRDIAEQIVHALSETAEDTLEPAEIAGPGFINLRLKDDFIQTTLESIPPAPTDDADQSRAPFSPRLCRGTDRLGIEPVADAEKQTVVVDYSSPNVAKEMHVGHLRSTIIGDTLARVLEFQGHEVIRQNHIGDWGTPMGMVVVACMSQAALDEKLRTGTVSEDYLESPEFARSLLTSKGNIALLESLYKQSVQLCKEDASYSERVSEVTKRLQAQEPAIVKVWEMACKLSLAAAFDLYSRLNVELGMDSVRGESFYEPFLSGVVEELRAALQSRDREGADRHDIDAEARPLPDGRGSDKSAPSNDLRAVCREDQGALCVFLENPDGTPAFKGPQGDPLPMIIEKSDGAFLYSTTDLAALYFRINDDRKQPITLTQPGLRDALREMLQPKRRTLVDERTCDKGGLGGSRILYVVGSPQKLHFQMLFATVRALGWTRPGDGSREVQLEHVPFGSVLGENRKMLKTRTGENVKLKDLLEEAVLRAEKQVRTTEADPAKRRGFDDAEIKRIAETVGVAAVKYADLCQNRNTDYVFSWEKMLALQGNTAPYMLYAYARIRSIYRKGNEARPFDADIRTAEIRLQHDAERDLALAILRLPETIDSVAESLLPNILCEYLYDLAARFMVFYESCPVLRAPDADTCGSRLRLCEWTARALRLGLGLLGIATLERM